MDASGRSGGTDMILILFAFVNSMILVRGRRKFGSFACLWVCYSYVQLAVDPMLSYCMQRGAVASVVVGGLRAPSGTINGVRRYLYAVVSTVYCQRTVGLLSMLCADIVSCDMGRFL